MAKFQSEAENEKEILDYIKKKTKDGLTKEFNPMELRTQNIADNIDLDIKEVHSILSKIDLFQNFKNPNLLIPI